MSIEEADKTHANPKHIIEFQKDKNGNYIGRGRVDKSGSLNDIIEHGKSFEPFLH